MTTHQKCRAELIKLLNNAGWSPEDIAHQVSLFDTATIDAAANEMRGRLRRKDNFAVSFKDITNSAEENLYGSQHSEAVEMIYTMNGSQSYAVNFTLDEAREIHTKLGAFLSQEA